MLQGLYRIVLVVCLAAGLAALAPPARAQDSVYIQIEARPTLAQAEDRARAYASAFPNTTGFRMRSGWYAIALGPYSPGAAEREIAALRRDRLIPSDSFIAFPRQFRQQFWPVDAEAAAQPPAPETPQPDAAETPLAQEREAPAPVAQAPEETVAEARRGESRLTREERLALQEALKFEGHYDGALDAAIGPNTRSAMASYQRAEGFRDTGVLTTRQRNTLMQGYRAAFEALGLARLTDERAGIELVAPMGLVEFERVEAPFVHYTSSDERGVRLLLLSQSGDQSTLFGLYDIMQTLEIVPQEGARTRDRNSFTLRGENADLHSYTHARLAGGAVKGFTLVWKPEDAKIMNAVVEQMRESFAATRAVLPDGAGQDSAEQSIDLLAGLEIRTPEVSRSGFYVDANGAVLTTTEVLGECSRVTVGAEFEADVAARDDTLGLALLKPRARLVPVAHARFAPASPRLKSEIAVAGYSYEEVLDLPTLTFGTLADVRGLDGEASMQRLSLSSLPGDAGGPVFDSTGAVLGMLLARDGGGDRQLPPGVQFAASVPAIAEFLSANGLNAAAAEDASTMAPEDMTSLASDMTVLVSCWP